MARPSLPRAVIAAVRGSPVATRRNSIDKPDAVGSGGAIARAARPLSGSMIRTVPRGVRVRASARLPSLSMPSLSQVTAIASDRAPSLRARATRSAAASRSVPQAIGLAVASKRRAASGRSRRSGAGASPLLAVRSMAASRPSRSASSSSRMAARLVSPQFAAPAQPLSITINSGRVSSITAGGVQTGRDRPRITRAAMSRRNRISHQGACCGVSASSGAPNSRRSGGKMARRGAGGVARSSSHNMGRLSRPIRASGAPKERGPSANIRHPSPGRDTAPARRWWRCGRCDG